jgi:hypothetical protein
MRNHPIHKTSLVNRLLRIFRDLERPQQEHSVDEDRPVCNVSAGADPVRSSSAHTRGEGRKGMGLPPSESE